MMTAPAAPRFVARLLILALFYWGGVGVLWIVMPAHAGYGVDWETHWHIYLTQAPLVATVGLTALAGRALPWLVSFVASITLIGVLNIAMLAAQTYRTFWRVALLNALVIVLGYAGFAWDVWSGNAD